ILGKNSHRLEKQTNHASVSIKQLSGYVVTLGESIEKMRSDLKKLTNNVGNTTKAALNALKTSDTTNTIFSSFIDSSKELDKIDKVVATLAQQINIFALNASIEAARSGEAGRGFTVVANEIKELSKETFKIAEDIRAKIENFFNDAKEAINALSEINNLVLQIKNNQSSMEDALKEQLDELNEIGKLNNSMVRASNAVTDNILNVYKLAKINTENIEKAIRVFHQLSRQSTPDAPTPTSSLEEEEDAENLE
ncbi:MAG: methyl-accepting chemotaxis protein, partial [Leptospiraceae bacterium]|nr:methyl-accepting chemotaxis protein [Leptospiraceae bacterium]